MTFEKDLIGVVGHGFVGHALHEGMKHALTVKVYDKFRPLPPDAGGVFSMKELAQMAEVIFVCVPTPMREDGSCDTSIVTGVVREIDSFNLKNVVVIKSTVPPGTTEMLHRECKGLTGVVFNPEFLTEANYIEDFKNQNRIILGCSDDLPKTIVKRVYQRAFPKVPTVKTHPAIAEMVKYTTNTFLATKVAFANEIKQVCDALSIDYDKVIEYARFDERLGSSHWAVPGPDGKFGFGGSCFPKDINSLIFRARELGVLPLVLSAAWKKNLEIRPERDWEQLKGRAVVKR
jgi:UDPglucose 6-dehydrogenase